MAKLRPKKLGAYAGTEETQGQILDATESVLRRDGYAACTTRQVAVECGISNGNVTYHFPTKQTLIEATIARVLRRYHAALLEVLEQETLPAELGIRPFVAWLIRDAASQELRDLMVELWAMGKVYPYANTLMTTFYAELIGAFADKFAQTHAIDKQRLIGAGYLCAAMSEGTTVLFSGGEPPGLTLDDHVDNACIAFEAVLTSLANANQ